MFFSTLSLKWTFVICTLDRPKKLTFLYNPGKDDVEPLVTEPWIDRSRTAPFWNASFSLN